MNWYFNNECNEIIPKDIFILNSVSTSKLDNIL